MASTLGWSADQKGMEGSTTIEMEKALKFGSDAHFKEITQHCHGRTDKTIRLASLQGHLIQHVALFLKATNDFCW
jgi:hypothetical protein